MSTVKTNAILDANGGNTTTINGVTPTQYNTMGKNRIINGDMRIDQRNAGAAVTANGSYAVDRFRLNQNIGSWSWQQDSSAPTGFDKSTKVTVTSSATPSGSEVAYYSQQIEGNNVYDFQFGTASAKTITLSFWVKSSVTGAFGLQFSNSANDRSYVESYTISSANTWEYKSITLVGDTSGTWLTDNGVGIRVRFDLGGGPSTKTTAGSWVDGSYLGGATGTISLVETNGATWYITGVQLEVGSVATEFERRPYGTELALCQRYFECSYNPGTAVGGNANIGGAYITGTSDGSSNTVFCGPYRVTKRAVPTQTFYQDGGTSGSWDFMKSGLTSTTTMTAFRSSQTYVLAYCGVGSTWAAVTIYGHWTASAEL